MRLSILLVFLIFLPTVAIGEFIICDMRNVQLEPAIGFDGTDYLVVWNDCRETLNTLYGTRVTHAGIVVDTGGVRLLSEFDLQQHPALDFDGTNYLVAWQFGC